MNETPSIEIEQGGGGCRPVITIALMFVVAIFVCGCIPFTVGTILVDQVWFLPADGSTFDPIANLSAVHDFAGRDYDLVSIEAEFVRVDGTMDLYADYGPNVVYRFSREIAVETGPLGTSANTSGVQYETVQVEVAGPGFRTAPAEEGGVSIMPFLGMDRDMWLLTDSLPGEFMPEPACDFARLWGSALEMNTPREAVAIIDYERGEYRFRIEGTAINLRFDLECRLLSR